MSRPIGDRATARKILDRQHRLILIRAGLATLTKEERADYAGSGVDIARAEAKAECARCCAVLRAEKQDLFRRLANEHNH